MDRLQRQLRTPTWTQLPITSTLTTTMMGSRRGSNRQIQRATATSTESPDPNGDGHPRDAVDTDHDGQPDWLDPPLGRTNGAIAEVTVISMGSGGSTGAIDVADSFGHAVASIGDVDENGVTDLAVGAQTDDTVRSEVGAVWILLLNSDGSVGSHTKLLPGPGVSGDHFGAAIAPLGDLDGDGSPEIVVGSPDVPGGRVTVLFLDGTGAVKSEVFITNADLNLLAATIANGDGLGESLGKGFDRDGDGLPELLVGTERSDGSLAEVLIVSLDANGLPTAVAELRSQLPVAATSPGDEFGASITSAGDIDGDGVIDHLIGSPRWLGGGSAGLAQLISIDSDASALWSRLINNGSPDNPTTISPDARFTFSLAPLGDLGGDGSAEIAVGASGGGASDGDGTPEATTSTATIPWSSLVTLGLDSPATFTGSLTVNDGRTPVAENFVVNITTLPPTTPTTTAPTTAPATTTPPTVALPTTAPPTTSPLTVPRTPPTNNRASVDSPQNHNAPDHGPRDRDCHRTHRAGR
ncbi:MAG: hypothetical protein ACI8Y4_000938 [Candidatus Poriferisodalaceae bacterium]